MKKSLIIPIVAGFVLIPGFVAAQSNTNDSITNGVNHEEKREVMPTVPGIVVPQANHMIDDNPSSDDLNDDSNDGSSNQSTAAVASATITVEQAQSIAQNMFPDKTIKKVETENEHGVLVYSVRFSDSSRVDVSAQDGSVVRSESESEQEDESEHMKSSVDDSPKRHSNDD